MPVRGYIWGHDYTDATEINLASGAVAAQAPIFAAETGNSDAYNLAVQGSGGGSSTNPSAINALRILQPHYGQITSCTASFNMTFGSGDSGRTCRLAIGTFSSTSPNFTPNTSYSDQYINSSWSQMNGASSPLIVSSNAINVTNLNLLPALYTYGNTYFVPEAFVLLIAFDQAPDGSTFLLNYLNIDITVIGII